MNTYKVLNNQIIKSGNYSLVPIRLEDRYDIMKWRNEQIYHLRQNKILTTNDQDLYFENVISKLFDEEKPNQILFSFLEEEVCVGYGGLVHINWLDNNAEISFVINTSKEEDFFIKYWEVYLNLIKRVAFKEINLHKIYTYAYDARPKLYLALENCGFKQESRLLDHSLVNGIYKDVLYHSFINPKHTLSFRIANINDMLTLFEWVNDHEVRQNSLNSDIIKLEDHQKWFNKKIIDDNCKIYIFLNRFNDSIGQVRIERVKDEWVIDYSVDKNYRQLGLGNSFLKNILEENIGKTFKAFVKSENIASIKVFRNIGFCEKYKKDNLITFVLNT
jgi:RimJ/RimL family protein N-acetyltransferase